MWFLLLAKEENGKLCVVTLTDNKIMFTKKNWIKKTVCKKKTEKSTKRAEL